MDDLEGARQTLEELGRINQDAVTVAGRFWESLLRAEIERTAGNLDLAQEAMNQIDAMAPEYRWAHFEHVGRARLLAASGDAEGAIAAYLAALDPRSWEGWPAVASRITTLLELASSRMRSVISKTPDGTTRNTSITGATPIHPSSQSRRCGPGSPSCRVGTLRPTTGRHGRMQYNSAT